MNEDSIVITFVGDVALHSAIGETSIDPFQYIRNKLNFSDLLVANLKSPFRGDRGENLQKVAGDISEIKKRVDTCIVYIHWGGK